MKTAEEILKAIVGDVEAMRCEPPFDIGQLGIPEENEHWFGGFSESECYDGDYDSPMARIQWPNLGILIAEAKELLGNPEQIDT